VTGRATLCVPKTLSVLMTCWNRLTALFRTGRPSLTIQVETAA
jgi:hypothetical protein